MMKRKRDYEIDDGKSLKVQPTDKGTNGIVGKCSVQPNTITEEHHQWFISDRWYTAESNYNGSFYRDSVRLLHSVYVSIKETTSDMIEVLKDETARKDLLKFTSSIYDSVTYCGYLEKINAQLLEDHQKSVPNTNLQTEGIDSLEESGLIASAAGELPEELSGSGKDNCPACGLSVGTLKRLDIVLNYLLNAQKQIVELEYQQSLKGCCARSNPDFLKICNMLLIMKAVLVRFFVLCEVSEYDTEDKEATKVNKKLEKVTGAENLCVRCKNNNSETKEISTVDIVDKQSSQTLQLIADAVNQLNTSLKRQDSLFAGLIASQYHFFTPNYRDQSIKVCDRNGRVHRYVETYIVELGRRPHAVWFVSKNQKCV